MKKYIIKLSRKFTFIRFVYNLIRINFFFRLGFFYNFIIRKFSQKNISSEKKDLTFLKQHGYMIEKKFFDNESINSLSIKFNQMLERNFDKFKFDIHPEINTREFKTNNLNCANVYKFTNYVSLPDPLLYFPEIIDLIDKKIINLIYYYFGVMPSLTGINLRRSFSNNLPQMGTQNYHSDENSFHFLKCFIYLNNVTLDNGPFTYVAGSHLKKNIFDSSKYHYSDESIKKKFGAKNIKHITGDAGDFVIANTKGYHKGNRLIQGYRDMFTLHFGLHREYFKKNNGPKIYKNILNNITENQKSFMDLAIIK